MLQDLKIDEIEFELKQSKKDIEREIGSPIDSFSYPYKFPEKNTKLLSAMELLLKNAKYKNGVSTRIGTLTESSDFYFMKRIPINTFDDLKLFRTKLRGGYNWLYYIQCMSKYIKR